MRRAAENRACAVIHQDEIGDIDGQFPSRIKGVAHSQACVEPHLFGLFQRLCRCATLATLGTEFRDLGAFCFQLLGQRMIGRDAHKTCTHQRIGPRCIDFDPIMAAHGFGQAKAELQTARLADPIGLHQAHFFWPVIQTVQRC